MMRIRINKSVMPDKHWIVYRNSDGIVKHVDLSGCASSFAASTGIVSQGELRCVGWRYQEGGQLCYELFNVGHLVLCAPLKPSPVQRLLYLIQGKDPDTAYQKKLEEFEEALKAGGWMTMPRPEQA